MLTGIANFYKEKSCWSHDAMNDREATSFALALAWGRYRTRLPAEHHLDATVGAERAERLFDEIKPAIRRRNFEQAAKQEARDEG